MAATIRAVKERDPQNPEPVRIEPDGWYSDGATRLMLDVNGATLARARRSFELRFTRRGKRIWYQGQWLIEWLEQGKATPPADQTGSISISTDRIDPKHQMRRSEYVA